MKQRKLLHVDMDAFFAAVEQKNNPALKGKPVIVAGKANKRGVVATCSYEARQYGIHSAMTTKEALTLCPHAVVVPAHFELYRSISQQIRDIFLTYTDLVEPLSIDEAYLDVTENYQQNPSASIIAEQIQRDIFEQTGLTCSVGVSFNRFLAKVASGYQKPAGITVVDYENFEQFIDQLSVDDFYGVGKVTARKLHDHQIHTGQDLKQLSLHKLIKIFGKQGYILYYQVRGKSNNRVVPNRKRKSLAKEITFATDTKSEETLVNKLRVFSQELASELKEKELVAKTITVKLRNARFETMSKSCTLPHYVNGEQIIFEEALALFEQMYQEEWIRLIGVSIGMLEKKEKAYEQLTLF